MDRERRGSGDRHGNEEIPPPLYQVLKGMVTSLQPYGAFIKLPGRRKNGLVHRSQISKVPVEKPEEVLEIGEEVHVKVISHGEDGNKIALSMKCVNQTTGEDLDPNHIQISLDEQRRKTGFQQKKSKIELGAVLNTTCKKCGGKGHFAQECFQTAGSTTTYDLLPDIDHLVEQEKQAGHSAASGSKKKKKEKKQKKKKKHKKKAAKSDSESEDEHKAKKHKKHKHKSHKRRKEESSDEDSSSDSESEDDRKRKRPDKGRRHSTSRR